MQPLRTCTVAAFIAILTVTQSFAGTAPPPPPTPTPTATGSSRTTAFVGLNWVLGGDRTIEGIIGIAHGEVNPGGDVTGAKGAFHFRLNDGLKLRKVKLTGLFGSEHVQAEGGLGFNLENQSLFGIGGINGNFFAAGADLHFDGMLEGNAGVHSIGGF